MGVASQAESCMRVYVCNQLMVSLIPSGFPGFLLGSGSVVPLLHPSGSLQRMAARAAVQLGEVLSIKNQGNREHEYSKFVDLM